MGFYIIIKMGANSMWDYPFYVYGAYMCTCTRFAALHPHIL